MEVGGGEGEEGVGFVVQSRDLTVGGCCFRDLSLSLPLNRRSFPEADLLLSSSLPHTWKKRTSRQVLSLFPGIFEFEFLNYGRLNL